MNKLESTVRVQSSTMLTYCILSSHISCCTVITSSSQYVGLPNLVKKAIGGFLVRRLWPWTLTLTSQKIIVIFGTAAEHLCQISSKSPRTNEPSNKQTHLITMLFVGGNNKHIILKRYGDKQLDSQIQKISHRRTDDKYNTQLNTTEISRKN